MQNLKNLLLEYKRYIGAAALLFVLLLIFIFCTDAKPGGQNPLQQGTEGNDTQKASEIYQVNGKLEKNADPKLLELMNNYYSACAGGDTAALEAIAQPMSENEKSYIKTFSAYYEDYQNVVCYSMPGASEGSYLVSVCYDLKFQDVDTLAPGMDFFYVEKNDKDELIINNVYSAYNFNFRDQELDANLYSLILAYEKSPEVMNLQKEVQAKYDEAVKSDEKLANMVGGTLRNAMAQWRNSITSSENTQASTESSQKTEDTQNKEDTQKIEDTPNNTQPPADTGTKMVKTTDICKVRKEPSTSGELIGMVTIDVELEKLGTEGDWTKVKFQEQTGYIRSDLLKEVE